MKLDKKLNQRPMLSDNTGDHVYLSQPSNSYYVLNTLYNYDSYHMDYVDVTISRKHLGKFFEPVENFKSMALVKKESKFIPFISVFKHKTLNTYISINLDLTKSDLVDEAHDDSRYKKDYYKVQKIFFNPEEDIDGVSDFYSTHLEFNNNKQRMVSLVIKTDMGYTFKKFPINPLDVDISTHYNDDFKDVHNHIVDNLTGHGKGIIMLHGVPGTGKTNYIKWLTTQIDKQFVFVPSNLVFILTDPGFISTLIDEGRNSVIVLEDSEAYLKDRKKNGENSFVSNLLNISDGILSDILSLQIICTFNNDISDIDPALKRKGRLIAEYEFKELEEDKVTSLKKQLRIEDKKLKANTLAEIFNAKNEEYVVNKSDDKIGFK